MTMPSPADSSSATASPHPRRGGRSSDSRRSRRPRRQRDACPRGAGERRRPGYRSTLRRQAPPCWWRRQNASAANSGQTLPALSLADMQGMTDALLACGATINEMNCLRKHTSAVKGGQLARAAAPATLLTLALSDVHRQPPGRDRQRAHSSRRKHLGRCLGHCRKVRD